MIGTRTSATDTRNLSSGCEKIPFVVEAEMIGKLVNGTLTTLLSVHIRLNQLICPGVEIECIRLISK